MSRCQVKHDRNSSISSDTGCVTHVGKTHKTMASQCHTYKTKGMIAQDQVNAVNVRTYVLFSFLIHMYSLTKCITAGMIFIISYVYSL